MRKFANGVGLLIVAISIGVISFFAVAFNKFIQSPIIPSCKNVDYVLKPGASIKVLANDLYKLGLLDQPSFLIALGYWQGTATHLKAGEYLFKAGLKPRDLLNQIASGKVILHRFTLVEGWNFVQVISVLNKNSLLSHQLTNLNSDSIMIALGLPPRNPEGLFFPATYPYARETKDSELLKKAYKIMSSLLAKEWQNRAANLPYTTPYQALIAASLIEKETKQESERPLISGIIINRLNKGMPLQIDATVIYGLGSSYQGRLTKEQLLRDTPYNTYIHYGLPPTPIAMPSKSSIHAALHPLLSDKLYYVSKENGTHQFSATLQQQNIAVRTYQLNLVFPTVGKKFNIKTCIYLWYLSPLLQQLFANHCL